MRAASYFTCQLAANLPAVTCEMPRHLLDLTNPNNYVLSCKLLHLSAASSPDHLLNSRPGMKHWSTLLLMLKINHVSFLLGSVFSS